jgi:hypothetical protein
MRSCGQLRLDFEASVKKSISPPPHPIPYTSYRILKTIAETKHEIEHLGRIISPFIITVPGDVVYFSPE